MLEYPDLAATDFAQAYIRTTWQRQTELYKLFFDHGVETLLTPIFGPDLLERGDEYRQLVEPGLLWFTQDQHMLNFYDAYDVRVRVYGDTQRYFPNTPYAHVLEAFTQLTHRTAGHERHRLFFGVCAHDPTETVAQIAVRLHERHGTVPTKRQIVEAYYGEHVGPVDLFIGFDRPAAFDMPLISTGNEDLYFTISPSPYLDRHTLRAILYDHMYARRVDEADYTALSPEDWQTLADFYALNRHNVLGIGQKHRSGKFWHPLPQVKLPSPHNSNDGETDGLRNTG